MMRPLILLAALFLVACDNGEHYICTGTNPAYSSQGIPETVQVFISKDQVKINGQIFLVTGASKNSLIGGSGQEIRDGKEYWGQFSLDKESQELTVSQVITRQVDREQTFVVFKGLCEIN